MWRALVAILVLGFIPSFAHAGPVSPRATAALAKLLPAGYRTAAVLPCAIDGSGRDRFVAAVVDTAEINSAEKAVRLLSLEWTGRNWTLLDSVEISGREASLAPQYLDGIAVVKIGSANLLYVDTNWSTGGSGSVNYFQFYTMDAGHLKLVRGFEHERLERGLFCLRNDRIYDAEVVCGRGEKKGSAYEYSCDLATREYTFDGEHIVETRSERLEERRGNRFLGESYWNLSLRSVLRKGGHFLPLERAAPVR